MSPHCLDKNTEDTVLFHPSLKSHCWLAKGGRSTVGPGTREDRETRDFHDMVNHLRQPVWWECWNTRVPTHCAAKSKPSIGTKCSTGQVATSRRRWQRKSGSPHTGGPSGLLRLSGDQSVEEVREPPHKKNQVVSSSQVATHRSWWSKNVGNSWTRVVSQAKWRHADFVWTPDCSGPSGEWSLPIRILQGSH